MTSKIGEVVTSSQVSKKLHHHPHYYHHLCQRRPSSLNRHASSKLPFRASSSSTTSREGSCQDIPFTSRIGELLVTSRSTSSLATGCPHCSAFISSNLVRNIHRHFKDLSTTQPNIIQCCLLWLWWWLHYDFTLWTLLWLLTNNDKVQKRSLCMILQFLSSFLSFILWFTNECNHQGVIKWTTPFYQKGKCTVIACFLYRLYRHPVSGSAW